MEFLLDYLQRKFLDKKKQLSCSSAKTSDISFHILHLSHLSGQKASLSSTTQHQY